MLAVQPVIQMLLITQYLPALRLPVMQERITRTKGVQDAIVATQLGKSRNFDELKQK
jgi:hypothetical protein